MYGGVRVSYCLIWVLRSSDHHVRIMMVVVFVIMHLRLRTQYSGDAASAVHHGG